MPWEEMGLQYKVGGVYQFMTFYINRMRFSATVFMWIQFHRRKKSIKAFLHFCLHSTDNALRTKRDYNEYACSSSVQKGSCDWLLPSARHLENWRSLEMTVMSLREVTVISNDWPSASHFYWRHLGEWRSFLMADHLLVTSNDVISINKNYY